MLQKGHPERSEGSKKILRLRLRRTHPKRLKAL
jgi:hypothetical protein